MFNDNHNESIIHRFLTGEYIFDINGKLYKIIPPTTHTIHKAGLAYKNCIKLNRFEQWLSDSDCIKILSSRNLCSPNIDVELKELDRRIDDLKVSLFNNYINPIEYEKTIKQLEMVRSLFNTKTELRYSLNHLTLLGYAETIRQQYMTIFSLYDYNLNKLVWNSEEDVDMRLLETVMINQKESILTISDIRKLARSDLWRSYIGATNQYPFSVQLYQLNNEQRMLIMYTNMYNSIHQSSECPSDDIINNDDLLDGWLIEQRRSREKEKNKKEIESKISSKMHGSQDVSLPARTVEDFIKINNLNDIEGQIIQSQRLKQIKANGKITDAEFADKKLDIRTAQHQQFMNHTHRR